jgi:uncharacterized iron-regulated membrane protein
MSRRQRWWWDGFRPLLLRLHFFVGVFVGPFILIAAITGLLYALTPQLEPIVHRHELTVPVGSTKVSLEEQVRAAQQAVPAGTLAEIRPPDAVDGTTRVSFSVGDLDADRWRTAFVDPYTGDVRGVLTTYGEWLPVRDWFDTLHRTLMLGDVGRVYTELAASWLWVLAVSGLGIWLVRARRRHRVRRTLLPRLSGPGRGRLLTWHGSLGLWAAIGMLFLSATGLTWSQFAGANVEQLRSQLNWATPAVDTTLPADAGVTAGNDQLGTISERVLTTARRAGIDGPVAITPGTDGQAWTVSQEKRSWPVQQDSVAIDPVSGQVVQRIDFADWPIAAKLARWGIDAHMGLLFGVANQLALACLATCLITMIIVAYRMWWIRRPTRADVNGRLAAPLGAGQAPGRVAVLTVAGIAVLTGVFFPVLGGSLLIFLALDALRTTIRLWLRTRALQRA